MGGAHIYTKGFVNRWVHCVESGNGLLDLQHVALDFLPIILGIGHARPPPESLLNFAHVPGKVIWYGKWPELANMPFQVFHYHLLKLHKVARNLSPN